MAEIMKMFSERLPKVQGGFVNLMNSINESSTLDAKTRELIMVALLTAQKTSDGVKAHAIRAVEAGATIEDIVAAMSQAIPIYGIGTIMDCLPVIEELEELSK
ncbi:MAG: carboxymuconolactone decarboxylase family protein [Bacillota bacterium]|nr:carboxymuconolactone decarboxylase family protein [Bacillota bacterium]